MDELYSKKNICMGLEAVSRSYEMINRVFFERCIDQWLKEDHPEKELFFRLTISHTEDSSRNDLLRHGSTESLDAANPVEMNLNRRVFV
jgi:hypothetical protein